jgi:spermidine synthase
MAFGWACDNLEVRRQGLTTLQRRFSTSGIATRYYSPAIHRSAFALPRFLCDAIGKPSD